MLCFLKLIFEARESFTVYPMELFNASPIKRGKWTDVCYLKKGTLGGKREKEQKSILFSILQHHGTIFDHVACWSRSRRVQTTDDSVELVQPNDLSRAISVWNYGTLMGNETHKRDEREREIHFKSIERKEAQQIYSSVWVWSFLPYDIKVQRWGAEVPVLWSVLTAFTPQCCWILDADWLKGVD